MDFKSVHFLDFVKGKDYAVLALDISVNSTGWVLYEPSTLVSKPRLSFGVFTIPTECRNSNNAIRCAFRDFLIEKISEVPNTVPLYVVAEDVFGGRNFLTTRTLLRLNTVIDDLVLDGFLGDNIPIDNVKKLNNQSWKSFLRKVSGYTPTISGQSDKATVVGALSALGLFDALNSLAALGSKDSASSITLEDMVISTSLKGVKSKTVYPQDVWDAFGLLLYFAYSEGKDTTVVKLKKLPALEKCTVKVFNSEADLLLAFNALKNLDFKENLGSVDNVLEKWQSLYYKGGKKVAVAFETCPYNLGRVAFYPNFASLSYDYTKPKLYFLATRGV